MPMIRSAHVRTAALALLIPGATVLLTALCAPRAFADPYAILASVKGRVDVAGHDGAPQRATFGRGLERGDRVIVAAGGTATVYLSDGNVIELGENSTVTIGGTVKARGAGGTELSGGVYSQVSKFVTAGSRATGLVAMSTMRGGEETAPLIEEPRKSDVTSDRPAFRWREVPGATRYRVTVSGDEGDLWTREGTALTLEYPAEARALGRDGDFLWKLEALGDQGVLREETSVFHVIPAEMANTVDSDLKRIGETTGIASAAAQFLAGSYLSARGLYGEALRHFNELTRLSPDSPAPHEALGNVYRAVGLMDQAASEFQRALELTRKP